MSHRKSAFVSHSLSVFSNHLILSTIFKHLSLSDLKTCREINSMWNLEATKTITRYYTTKVITLRKEYFYPQEKYTVSLFKRDANNKETILKTDTLEHFMRIFTPEWHSKSTGVSRLLPCNNFALSDGHYLSNSRQLQFFFWIFGSSIERFELTVLYDYEPKTNILGRETKSELKSMFQLLFTYQLPNLKHLVVHSVPDEWKGKSFFKFVKKKKFFIE